MTPLALVLAGLLGAGGVMAAAASSHAGAALLGPAALIALTHAPALLALGLLERPNKGLAAAALLLGAGALAFCLDLAARQFWGFGLFPLAAPLSGGLMILGWLAVALAALLARRG